MDLAQHGTSADYFLVVAKHRMPSMIDTLLLAMRWFGEKPATLLSSNARIVHFRPASAARDKGNSKARSTSTKASGGMWKPFFGSRLYGVVQLLSSIEMRVSIDPTKPLWVSGTNSANRVNLLSLCFS